MTTPAVNNRTPGAIVGFIAFIAILAFVAGIPGRQRHESMSNQLTIESMVQPQLNLSLPTASEPSDHQSLLTLTGQAYVNPLGFKNVSIKDRRETFDGTKFVVFKVEKLTQSETDARSQPLIHNGEVELDSRSQVLQLDDPTLPDHLAALYESFCQSKCEFVTYTATLQDVTPDPIRTAQ